MERDDFYYNRLLEAYLENDCSPKEVEELFDYLTKNESNRLVLQQLQKQFSQASPATALVSNKVREQLIKKIQADRVPRIGKRWWPRVAAAVILVVAGLGYLWFSGATKGQVANNAGHERIMDDVAPGSNKAILTMGDGSTIVLDSAGEGLLLQKDQVNIIKRNDGLLAYEKTSPGPVAAKVEYNTVSTPRGGQYQVELPDGSKVWLNAASSLRFPTRFDATERKVELTGEAYFEIAKNPRAPFRVVSNDMETEVLGTHFNIMSYENETAVRTTLLEGRVKVNRNGQSVMLVPGQQAVAAKANTGLSVNADADLDQVIAWKNGMFDFDNESIDVIMRQLSRWYDIDVVYDGAVPDKHYTGVISRSSNISRMVSMIELAGGVELTVKNKTVLVKNLKN